MHNCIYCKIIDGEVPSTKVYEDEHTYAFFDINPASEYHTLVIPKTHCQDIFDISEDQLCAVTCAVKRITANYQRKVGVNNVQIITSSGKEAQQDVMHFHFHIVPRVHGDGQDIKWSTQPELVNAFPLLLGKLST